MPNRRGVFAHKCANASPKVHIWSKKSAQLKAETNQNRKRISPTYHHSIAVSLAQNISSDRRSQQLFRGKFLKICTNYNQNRQSAQLPETTVWHCLTRLFPLLDSAFLLHVLPVSSLVWQVIVLRYYSTGRRN